MSRRVAEEEKRVSLNCLVSPATRAAIAQTVAETKESQGEVVDRAVALLAFGEEVKIEAFAEKAKRAVNLPPLVIDPVSLDVVGPLASGGRGKASFPVRGIRPKGDVKR